MDILEVLDQVRELLQSKGQVTYRILKRQFALDDEALEDLKDELLFSYPEITEVDGRGLVWKGEKTPQETGSQAADHVLPWQNNSSKSGLKSKNVEPLIC